MTNECSSTSKTLDFYYNAFDQLGYSKSLAEKRVLLWDKAIEQFMVRGKLWHEKNDNLDLIIVGSRGEGCGILSDVDVLFVHLYVKCFEESPTFLPERPSQAVFQLDFKDVPEGYTTLKLIKIDDLLDATQRSSDPYLTNIRDALVEKNGLCYLRNDRLIIHDISNFLNESITKETVFADINGPARSVIFDAKYINVSMDLVQSFPCFGPSVGYNWSNRPRKYNWPPKNLIETVKGLDVLVVPVGKKDATDEILQWRISQTFAEQALVRSFNDPQIKIFAALKMLVKHELKPICENITSYVVKNTIFWVFEKSRPVYTKGDFFDVLLYSLRYLKVSIEWKYLPNYMMPSRNLLESKVSVRDRTACVGRLNDMIEEGSDILLRCPLVNEMFEMPHNRLQEKMIYRELLDQIFQSVVAFPSTNLKLYFRFLYELKKSK
ncbi:uncharacterized protein LOC123565068 [Mercenaria mercenaria]|uniref:uncharacterized protein LOC123565068 n=1 Tax=Mercenaria mercenaria TaxID=6596 RepID=UPI00234E64CF|nr:uncharacterized protein LOC123565068 [Mercenaria mercenaria]